MITIGGSVRSRVTLLGLQAFALGLTMAWITIPANTVFMETFGPGLLPVTYIGAALAGVVASAFLARSLRVRPLASVAIRLLVTVTVGLAALGLVMSTVDASWLSFAVLVLLPIAIPVGFMFVVGQAGMLLDVRVLKVLYPRVIAGFALGFAFGGLAGSPLIAALGGTEELFVAAAAASAALLALVLVTLRAFPAELDVVELEEDPGDQVTLRTLLTHRFVALIMAFQMLSALESQWLDYAMYDRAYQRYPDSADLAEFIGRFSAITYGADIVFLLLIAGIVLRRFGLRLGLTANPGIVLTMVLVVLAATAAQGSGATVVFVLIVATRVSDLVLSDAASRTSVGTAYQAVPGRLRVASQSYVESMAVPVAIGTSGVVLLVVQATIGTDGPVMFVLAGIVLAAWLVCATEIYRAYRSNLLANLRHRLLEPGDLALAADGALLVVEKLLDSDDPRDVRLGLHALASLEHPDLPVHLERLASQERPDIHAHVFEQLATVHPDRAVVLARTGLAHADALVRATGLATLATLGTADDATAAATLLHDPDPTVALAAATVISRHGTKVEHEQVGLLLDELAASTERDDRVRAGTLMARCGPDPSIDRRHLRDLLVDADDAVVTASLAAVTWPLDGDLCDRVVDLLERRGTAGAAVDALVRGGDAVVPLLGRCLDPTAVASTHGQVLCARAAREIGTVASAAMLRAHASHPDRDVGLAIVRSLGALAWSGDGCAIEPADLAALSVRLTADLEHAARLLQAIEVLDGVAPGGPLRAALIDEARLVRRLVLAELSLRHGVEPIGRVEFQLAQPSTRIHAMAMEWLDVTLGGSDRRAMTLLDPSLSEAERARLLGRSFHLVATGPDEVIRDIVEDPDDRWRRPWLRACAIIAAAATADRHDDLPALVGAGRVPDLEGIVQETLAGLERREGTRG